MSSLSFTVVQYFLVIKDWKRDVAEHTKKGRKASPVMLIISSGGQRAADVLRYSFTMLQ